MYLQALSIRNFRCIENLDLNFNKGLNILIGENNAGKTAIIDALRICFGYGGQKRDLYISLSEFHIVRNEVKQGVGEIEFHLTFCIEDEKEVAWFNDLYSVDTDGKQTLQLHFSYHLTEDNRVRYQVWGGSKKGQPIAPEVLHLIYYVHLDALRDAEQYLRPIRGNRLGQLYCNIQIDKDIKKDLERKSELAKKVRSAVDSEPEWVSHLLTGKKNINEHLEHTSFTHKKQEIDISFLPFDFSRLVDNLKIQMPVYADAILKGDPTIQKHFELFQNGLGYNNLIYTATILGDLQERKALQNEGYAALLIEEPEAHLHPQLQNLFFSYLNKFDTEKGFQIFVTSHSPTITAKAKLETVIVLQNPSGSINALSISKSGLEEKNRKFLHKFLDVTKSQMFFANGIILVEGISEALLLPIFSDMMGEEFNVEKAGIELVNINGVAFSHFANLFNSEDDSKNLSSRCSLITDDDRGSESDEIDSRAKIAKDLERKNLKVYLAERTFEFELFIAGNKDVLISIFTEMHPVAASRIGVDIDLKKHAENFLKKVTDNKAKSELAHRLAVKLGEDKIVRDAFKIPQYLQNAIKYAVKG